jgi:formate dehydrogenase (coenzyme F420) beta subunit
MNPTEADPQADKRSAGTACSDFFQALLEKDVVDAVLVPQHVPGGKVVAHTLVTDPSRLEGLDLVAPVLMRNSATAVSELSFQAPRGRIAAVMRPCEIKALVELVKFKQANLDNIILIGLDCPGTYEPEDYRQIVTRHGGPISDEVCDAMSQGKPPSCDGYELREACRMCEHPAPANCQILIALWGADPASGPAIVHADEKGKEILQMAGFDPQDEPSGRSRILEEITKSRAARAESVIEEFRQRIGNLQGLINEFAACKRCMNCRRECPICYCRECIFSSPTFAHESNKYLKWARQRKIIKMPVETLLFHLTRLNHMVTSCVGCGQCSSACPSALPVMELFRTIASGVQKIFDYVPGANLEEEPPLVTFREEELEPR